MGCFSVLHPGKNSRQSFGFHVAGWGGILSKDGIWTIQIEKKIAFFQYLIAMGRESSESSDLRFDK